MSDSGLRAIRLMRIRLLLLAVFFTVVRTAAFSQPSADLLYMAITRDVPADKYVYNWRDAVLLKSLTDVYRSCPEQRERASPAMCRKLCIASLPMLMAYTRMG